MEGQHSSDRLQILGVGALNVDYLFSVEQLVIDGESSIKEFHKSPGGSAANTVSVLSQLGLRAGVFGIVGTDPDGEFIEDALSKKGVTLLIKRSDGPTGKAFVFVEGTGRRSIYVMPGVNLELENINYPEVYNFDWVHATSLVGEGAAMRQLSWLLRLPEKIKLSFSPGMLYSKWGLTKLEAILRRSHILFLNKDELLLLLSQDNNFPNISQLIASPSWKTLLREILGRLHKMGPKLIALTLGRDGALLSSPEGFLYEPSHAHKVIDSTGAGDAFAAGVLYGINKGLDMEKCLKTGQRLAAKALEVWGSQIEVTQEEVQGFNG